MAGKHLLSSQERAASKLAQQQELTENRPKMNFEMIGQTNTAAPVVQKSSRKLSKPFNEDDMFISEFSEVSEKPVEHKPLQSEQQTSREQRLSQLGNLFSGIDDIMESDREMGY